MSASAEIRELASVVRKHRDKLERIQADLVAALENEIATIGRTGRTALIPAGLLENYYTCLETVMLRVSQHFENNLSADRWHSELLKKMTLRIEGVRVELFDEATYNRLLDLLKFRHFRRYYFETEYDWDRIDYLISLLNKAHPDVVAGMEHFLDFLEQLS